ncbi:hypothetical protein GCM10010230_02670 [Streptomyces narbonensis]|nr:hypothetical protein GCM10010230_02670 [Streptomyces narbonensis]
MDDRATSRTPTGHPAGRRPGHGLSADRAGQAYADEGRLHAAVDQTAGRVEGRGAVRHAEVVVVEQDEGGAAFEGDALDLAGDSFDGVQVEDQALGEERGGLRGLVVELFQGGGRRGVPAGDRVSPG